MKVFVLGGTGAIGRHVIPALVRAGHSVSALARTAHKAAWVRDRGATPVSVSLFDRAALTAAFAGHEAVINLTSAMPPMSRQLALIAAAVTSSAGSTVAAAVRGLRLMQRADDAGPDRQRVPRHAAPTGRILPPIRRSAAWVPRRHYGNARVFATTPRDSGLPTGARGRPARANGARVKLCF